MDLKVGRNVLNINKDDLILDNGKCYQIITKRIGYGWDRKVPVMSKKLFNELNKSGFIFTNNELKEQAENKYDNLNITYWKFDIDKMINAGY